MTKEELVQTLEQEGMTEALELIEDAEKGRLTALELAPSLGLLRNDEWNEALLSVLQAEGVEIIYVDEES
ncbi:hypothetical protein [Alkalicoccus luteus]|uniref:Uncharacterized protein n=1 Tax=Alkalicoccus luteus TaxID=1237094 RepID=A0A969PVX4_9BACI|nr:hypothetical protein [Alkalicoccus luteus]NJP38883.1 hypothetical protein [Alkalicoccus luteus]